MSRRKRRGLAEDQIGLAIKPQKCICCIKTEGELGYHKAWWIEKVPSRKIWVRCLEEKSRFWYGFKSMHSTDLFPFEA